MGRVLPGRGDEATEADPSDGPGQPTESTPPPKGVRIVPLRAVRTMEGYRSVYSDLTRTTTGSVLRTVVRGAGELCITFGLVILLFAAYEVWGKAAIVNAHQDDLDRQLAQEWEAPAAPAAPEPSASPGLPPPSGDAIARMYIPRLGKQWVVVQGVDPGDIKFAPGHYPDTAMPGQDGNFSVAGHRTPAIFWDLDTVRTGDPVVVETRDAWYVYEVYRSMIVSPHAVEVVAPVKGRPRVLTITTCNPKWDNYERLVVHAELRRSQPRADGRPAELGS